MPDTDYYNYAKRSKQIQPKKRSKLRLKLGTAYYTAIRYLLWLRYEKYFSRIISKENLPYRYFSHQSVLLRKLQGVDMQYQYNKITNLKLAVGKIDGIIIRPGEIFSYWKLIGKPTYKKGYLDGLVLFCGKIGTGAGGGLCQLSNLIYWMTLHTPLTVIERHRHSFDVFPDSGRTLPFGSGATCNYPYMDLMIRNDTDQDFQLRLYIDDEYLRGEWRSSGQPCCTYKVIEKNHKISGEYWGGFIRHNELYRQIIDLDGNILEEFITENNAIMMYPPFIE